MIENFSVFKNEYLKEVKNKNVIRRIHPQYPNLAILTYSDRCVFRKNWNPITRFCREVIVDEHAGVIVAAPMQKFYKAYETCDVEIKEPNEEDLVEATQKYDGIQAEHYLVDGRVYWAAKGSFISKAAKVAQRIWDESYQHVEIPEEWTLIIEVVGEETKNVIMYEHTDIILLAMIHKETGNEKTYAELEQFASKANMLIPERKWITYSDLKSEVSDLDHTKEGYVVKFTDETGKLQRLKVKSKRYMEVFYAIKLMSEKQKMDLWLKGELDQFIANLPVGFRQDFIQKRNLYDLHKEELRKKVQFVYYQAPKATRKEIAIWSQQEKYAHSAMLFNLFDGKSIEELLKKAVIQELKVV